MLLRLVGLLATTALTLATRAGSAGEETDWEAVFKAKLDELRAQGEPLTVEEIVARRTPIPDAENSALVLLKAFAARDAFYLPYGSSVRVGFAPEVGMRQPEAFLQVVRASVEANAKALRLIHEGTRLGRGRYPITLDPNPLATPQLHLGPLSAAGRLCLREAAVRAHEGKGDDAADSVLAIRRLSASLGDCLFLAEAIVQALLVRRFCDGLEWTLGLCELSPGKIDAISRELKSEEGTQGLAMPLRAERAAVCYLLTHFEEWQRTAKEFDIPPNLVDRARIPAEGSEYLEYMRQAIYISDLPDREKLSEVARLSDEVINLPPEEHLVTAVLLPSLRRAFEEEVKARASLRVARAALAVEQYRMRNGDWPGTLDALVPDLLDAVPQDPFGAGPLGYKRDATGIVVFSVGPDGQEERVRSTEGARTVPPTVGPDLSFHLLEPTHRGSREWQPSDSLPK